MKTIRLHTFSRGVDRFEHHKLYRVCRVTARFPPKISPLQAIGAALHVSTLEKDTADKSSTRTSSEAHKFSGPLKFPLLKLLMRFRTRVCVHPLRHAEFNTYTPVALFSARHKIIIRAVKGFLRGGAGPRRQAAS